jgi:hypothetical protein
VRVQLAVPVEGGVRLEKAAMPDLVHAAAHSQISAWFENAVTSNWAGSLLCKSVRVAVGSNCSDGMACSP